MLIQISSIWHSMDRSILFDSAFALLAVHMFFHFGAANGITFYQPTLSDENGIGSRQKATLATVLGAAGNERESARMVCDLRGRNPCLLRPLSILLSPS